MKRAGVRAGTTLKMVSMSFVAWCISVGIAAAATNVTATAGSNVITNDTLVPVSVAVGAGGAVVAGAWWLSSLLTRITDRLDAGNERFSRVEKSLSDLGDKMNTLRCVKDKDKSCEL